MEEKTTMEHKKIKIYRIRGTALLSAVLAVLFIITGCTGGKPGTATAAPTGTPNPAEMPTATPDPRPHFAEVKLPFEPTLNYFAAPEAVLEVLTENELQGYPAVVAAYMNYETGVDLPGSKDDYPNLLRLIDMYFPVFFADIYDTTIRFSEGENGCRLEWSYFSSSREEHNTLFHRFENRVAELLKPSEGAKSRIMQAVAVYQKLTTETEYDFNEETVGGESVPVMRHCYDAVTEGLGVCWCFGRSYCFLLCQLGFEALTVHGIAKDLGLHEWTLFKYNDEWYYADPTWDIGGSSLLYYGFTADRRELNGYMKNAVYYMEGENHLAADKFDVSALTFSAFFTGVCYGDSYELDYEGNAVVFHVDNGTEGEELIRFELPADKD